MNVTEVKMDQVEALKAFKEYRGAFMAERNRTDGELMRSYKALSEGKTLISLREAITKGGADERGLPNLAIARADETVIEVHVRRDGGLTYGPRVRARSEDRIFELPSETLPVPPGGAGQEWWKQPWNNSWQASLPFIPPRFRPPHGLVNYHLLWEAEWRRSMGPQRRDPMLLKRLGGDLFAVLAAWDLTEIEKLVLAR